jgi:CheY-like chemotaxis protein
MLDKPRVLIVDDDDVIATTLSMILNAFGFDSVAAFSGPEALQMAGASAFDILLTDVMMEPMNGVELANAFCELHPHARVFLISGTGDRASAVLADFQCSQTYPLLNKPIHPSDLIQHLRAATTLARAGDTAELRPEVGPQ